MLMRRPLSLSLVVPLVAGFDAVTARGSLEAEEVVRNRGQVLHTLRRDLGRYPDGAPLLNLVDRERRYRLHARPEARWL